MKPLLIAITKAAPGKYSNYIEWLRLFQPDIEYVDLGASADPTTMLEEADGLLLPGGGDVHPSRYGKNDPQGLCNDIDPDRDHLEMQTIASAIELRKPILGICRGCQIANVALGGTLIFDLPSHGKSNHGKFDGKDSIHAVTAVPDSQLATLMQSLHGSISSAHHQAADMIAPDLRCTATSDDGVVEALEWREPADKPYLMLVQWHPERMIDRDTNEYSAMIAKDFLRAVDKTRR